MVYDGARRETQVQPVVPVTQIIESSLAKVQLAAHQSLGQLLEWPDLASAIAFRICIRVGIPLPAPMRHPVPELDQSGFRRAPMIAVYGFLLDQVGKETRRAWVTGIETLRGRDQFPGDRDSFVFNPREVLGIAHGLMLLNNDEDGHREWFANLLIRGLTNKQLSSPQTQLAAHIALEHVCPAKSRDLSLAPVDMDELTMDDLVLAATMICTIGGGTVLSMPPLEATFSKRLMSEPVTVTDSGEAAALLHLCKRLIDQISLVNRSAGALDLVLALCRRFSLFGQRLNYRYNQRIPLQINDEYDVQDLFHAILLLHFDDVRPEEWTPTYAGNASRVDFYLPDERLIVEVKMTRKTLQQREIVKQLTEDATRYAAMDRVDTLICLVYDPENYCKFPAALEKDVEESGRKLTVKAIVCPRGI